MFYRLVNMITPCIQENQILKNQIIELVGELVFSAGRGKVLQVMLPFACYGAPGEK